MNINAITGSKPITESLPIEAIRPVSAKGNIADPMEKAQSINQPKNQSRLNGKQKPTQLDNQARLEGKKANSENKEALSIEDTQALVEELNEYMDDLQTNLGFSLHETLEHQVVIEIKNRESEELIKQIPAEELINIKVKMEELSGLLFDERV